MLSGLRWFHLSSGHLPAPNGHFDLPEIHEPFNNARTNYFSCLMLLGSCSIPKQGSESEMICINSVIPQSGYSSEATGNTTQEVKSWDSTHFKCNFPNLFFTDLKFHLSPMAFLIQGRFLPKYKEQEKDPEVMFYRFSPQKLLLNL